MKMKMQVTCGIAALLTLLVLQTSALAADLGKIDVHVTGLRNNNGKVRVALFNNNETYSANGADKAVQKSAVDIKGQEADCTFDNVPYGEYAIRLFHDEDGSGTFYTGMFGIPKVQFGFSNNAHGRFGPASFDKAKFKLDSPELKMEIKMQHA